MFKLFIFQKTHLCIQLYSAAILGIAQDARQSHSPCLILSCNLTTSFVFLSLFIFNNVGMSNCKNDKNSSLLFEIQGRICLPKVSPPQTNQVGC